MKKRKVKVYRTGKLVSVRGFEKRFGFVIRWS